jgi:hypothetical protein
MPKRSFQERRHDTNQRYYQNRKARLQGQQQTDNSDDSGDIDSSFFEN